MSRVTPEARLYGSLNPLLKYSSMASDLHLIQRVASKWSSQDFESRYARLLLSMSRDQAKKILGFPPDYYPSEEEVKKRYHQKVIENHPDRGGDLDKMVEINVAKDVLTGKAQERWRPEPSPERTKYKPPPRPEAAYTVKGVPFAAAWSGAGIPSGTDWKFVSERVSLYSKGFPSQPGCVLYGQTATLHVFCAVFKQESTASVWPPTDADGKVFEVEEGWRAQVLTAPIAKDLSKIAAKYIKQVVSNFPEPGPKDGSVPKKYLLWPQNGGHPTEAYIEKIPYRGKYSLKEVLRLAGLITVDEDVAKGTMAIIDFWGIQNMQKHRDNPRGYLGSSGDFFLSIDGKEVKLDDETCKNIVKSMFLVVATRNFEYRKVYRLNRLKPGSFKGGAYYAFSTLYNCLTSEPSWVKEALEKNMELIKPEDRTASVFLKLCSDMSLKQASVVTGIPMNELILRVYD
jgi:hypothetical protein